MSEHNPYYPLFLNLSGKKCTVLGGGQVALRKVTSLLKYFAMVTVISPRLCAGLRKLADDGKIKVISRPYRAGDLDGAVVAIVATSSDAVNNAATAEAREKKVPVNVVDNPGLSDFIVPSIVRRGNLTLAVSTAGSSPALARRIRRKLEQEFGTEYATLTRLVAEVRASLKKRKIKVSSMDWQDALDLDTLIGQLKQGQAGKTRETLLASLIKSKNKQRL
jgi:siroheme synthase-like protein